MPVSFPPVHPYPGTYRTLGDAALDNLLIVMRCNGCHRTVHFLAADLAKVVGEDHYAHIPPFVCTRCGTDEYINMSTREPRAEDIGHVIVRRPRTEVRWYNSKLGDL
jgi:hypothetical protein